jgi:hypothetical protein
MLYLAFPFKYHTRLRFLFNVVTPRIPVTYTTAVYDNDGTEKAQCQSSPCCVPNNELRGTPSRGNRLAFLGSIAAFVQRF